ncbi:MAG: hypothetical protein KAT77_01190 [Nanoarchaeota archaeon]|nr:hypothetical protein [Nanoarchaeota archaeon]
MEDDESLRKEIISEMLSETKGFCIDFGKGFYQGVKMIYTLPSFLNQSKKDDEFNPSKLAGKVLGGVVGFGGFVGCCAVGAIYVAEGRLEGLLVTAVPVATNIGSGVYETVKSFYEETRDKLLIKQGSELLENQDFY